MGLLLAAALIACGEPDQSEPEGYFEQLARLTAGLDRDNTAADRAMNDELLDTSPSEVGDVFARVTLEGADRLDAVLEEAAALRPPTDAREAHEELVEASVAMAAEDRATAEALAGLNARELGLLTPRPAYLAAEARVDDACAAVQDLADAAGADVDLCVGMYGPPGRG